METRIESLEQPLLSPPCYLTFMLPTHHWPGPLVREGMSGLGVDKIWYLHNRVINRSCPPGVYLLYIGTPGQGGLIGALCIEVIAKVDLKKDC